MFIPARRRALPTNRGRFQGQHCPIAVPVVALPATQRHHLRPGPVRPHRCRPCQWRCRQGTHVGPHLPREQARRPRTRTARSGLRRRVPARSMGAAQRPTSRARLPTQHRPGTRTRTTHRRRRRFAAGIRPSRTGRHRARRVAPRASPRYPWVCSGSPVNIRSSALLPRRPTTPEPTAQRVSPRYGAACLRATGPHPSSAERFPPPPASPRDALPPRRRPPQSAQQAQTPTQLAAPEVAL